MVKSVHEQMEHVTSELRGSLLFTDTQVKRVEELVANTRDDVKTWMDYCRNIQNHFSELDKPGMKLTPTTTSTEPIFEIFPG